jgi:hypothetical protein
MYRYYGERAAVVRSFFQKLPGQGEWEVWKRGKRRLGHVVFLAEPPVAAPGVTERSSPSTIPMVGDALFHLQMKNSGRISDAEGV